MRNLHTYQERWDIFTWAAIVPPDPMLEKPDSSPNQHSVPPNFIQAQNLSHFDSCIAPVQSASLNSLSAFPSFPFMLPVALSTVIISLQSLFLVDLSYILLWI